MVNRKILEPGEVFVKPRLLLGWTRAVMLTLTVAIAIVMGSGLITSGKAAEADSIGANTIAITPPTFDLTTNPGDNLKESIMVENLTANNQNIAVSLENFVPLGTEGAVNITEQTNQYSMASWMTVSPSSSIIAPHGSQAFSVVINVPQNAEPGGKFASVVFSTGATNNSSKSSIAVTQRIGSLMLLRVSGQADESAKLQSFKTSSKGNNVNLTTLISDLGNVQVKPAGYITIKNMFGHQVANDTFPSRYILPGASRSFSVVWTHKGTSFGKYTASVVLLYGLSNKILLGSTSFIVIPWKLVGIIIVIIVIVSTVLYRGRKRLWHALRVLFAKDVK